MPQVLSFWLVVQLLALAVLPLAWRWLAALPSRGYALSKALGLLLVSYVFWVSSSLGFLRNSTGGILFSLLVVLVVSQWLGRSGWQQDADGRRPLLAWLRGHIRLVIVIEVLFLASLGLWAYFRSFSPEIATAGGEKFMELTFLNGILRSERFPPLDPWLSGFAISYYYFGYVMLAALTRLSGLPPGVAFNVGLATWFALTLTAAFGVAYDMSASLVARRRAAGGEAGVNAVATQAVGGIAYAGGLLGALFVGLLSNLAGFLESVQGIGLGSQAFWRWLDIKDLNCMAGPAYTQPIADCPNPSGLIPDRFFWWWRASRVINDRDLLGATVEVIDEFPFFSFLLGDMHPHVLALPFVLLAVGLALAVILGGRVEVQGPGTSETSWWQAMVKDIVEVFPLGWGGYVLYALCLGALAFLNTWDLPIYLFLVTLTVGARLAWEAGGVNWEVVIRTGVAGGGLGLASGLLYLPFYVGFQSQAGGILPNFIFPTRFPQFFVMFGPLLVAAVFLLLAISRDWRLVLRRVLRFLPWTLLLPIAFLMVALAYGMLVPSSQEFVRRLLELPVVQAQLGDASIIQLMAEVAKLRLATPTTYLILAGLLAWVLGLLELRTRISPTDPAHRSASVTFALLAMLTALLLAFSVEFVYLRDTFGTRMNTVFKFYFQAWVLMALVGALSVVYMVRFAPRSLRIVGLTLTMLLVVAGLFYPVFATYTRADRFVPEPTLDGTAYLARQNPGDAAAVNWLQANVPGQATVLEANGGSYTYAGRVSAQTGLPTLLGWDGHELQWRGDTVEQDRRRPDIERLYRNASPAELQQILDRWQIDYVVVGDLERRTFGMTPQSEARLAQVMDLVHEAEGVRIYRKRS